MKKSILVLLVLSVLLITGCGSVDSDVAYETVIEYVDVPGDAVYVEVPGENIYNDVSGSDNYGEGDSPDVSSTPPLDNRKIIYTANLTLESETPDDVYNTVLSKLSIYEGYVENETLTETRYTMKIRVKSYNLTNLVNSIKTEGELISYSKSSDDITSSYSTFEARKEALETQHIRILELIEIADTLESIVDLEEVRVDIESELNYIGIQMTNYDSLVEYSTVNLTINKAKVLEASELPKSSQPNINLIDKGTDSITIRVFNHSENDTVVYVNMKIENKMVLQFEEAVLGDGYVTLTAGGLDSDQSYDLEAYSLEEEHNFSVKDKMFVTTDKTFFNKTSDMFVGTMNSLVLVFEFIVLGLIAILPYAVVIGVVFVPIRIIYKKSKK